MPSCSPRLPPLSVGTRVAQRCRATTCHLLPPCSLHLLLSPSQPLPTPTNVLRTILKVTLTTHKRVQVQAGAQAPPQGAQVPRKFLTLDPRPTIKHSPSSMRRSKRVHMEFEAQAKQERAAGLPVTFEVDSSNPRLCAQVVSG